MPSKRTIQRAQQDRDSGRSPSTQAGKFVQEEVRKIRRGDHGARSPKQAIAIGLSEVRRAGVKLTPPSAKKASSAKSQNGERKPNKTSAKRARSALKALQRQPTSTLSTEALSKQAKESAAKRSPYQRHKAALKAVKTKGKVGLKKAARKAAHTREMHTHR